MAGLRQAGVDVFGLGAEMRMLARTAKLDNKLPEDLEQMLAADARAARVGVLSTTSGGLPRPQLVTPLTADWAVRDAVHFPPETETSFCFSRRELSTARS